MDEFTSFAARNTSFHKLAPSHLERHNDALWLADSTEPASWTDVAKQMHGEIAHVHGLGDFSGHVILSPADCKCFLGVCSIISLSMIASADSTRQKAHRIGLGRATCSVRLEGDSPADPGKGSQPSCGVRFDLRTEG